MNMEQEELLTQTQIIEQQPIAERAKSYEQLYEKLLTQLQQADAQQADAQQTDV